MKMVKIVTYVPLISSDKVRMAMGDAGAGKLGKYSHASFSGRGTGRFIPEEGAHPAVGQVGKLVEVEEEKIEVICIKEKVKDIVKVIKQTHPYEEIPIEIHPILTGKDF